MSNKNDLEKDNLAHKNINIAKRIQTRIKNEKFDKRSVILKNNEEVNGVFRLVNNNKLSLEICFPTIDLNEDNFRKLRNYLRRRNFKPKLWDSTEPINTELLFSKI